MTTAFDEMMATTELPTVRPKRRRIPGLRMPALPSATLLAQLGGGGAALSGVFGAWGWPATLIIGGVATVLLGALREAGKI
jgi:hypothetical protein